MYVSMCICMDYIYTCIYLHVFICGVLLRRLQLMCSDVDRKTSPLGVLTYADEC
jgi:hypothetical protein